MLDYLAWNDAIKKNRQGIAPSGSETSTKKMSLCRFFSYFLFKKK